MRTKRVITILLCLCAFFTTRAEVYTVENVPNPKAKGQNYYVVNPDGVLLPETETEINALCVRLHQATEVEFAVVVIDRYDDSRYDGYGFAYNLFNHWGIGNKNTNTGLLLFLAQDTREVQIITGDGIAGILPDGVCGEILDNNIDYFHDNDFNNGVRHVCMDIEQLLMTDDSIAELMFGWKPKDTLLTDGIALWMVIGMIVMVLLGWWGYKRIQAKPGQTSVEIANQTQGVRGCSGCLAFIFPIPVLFFYLYYKHKSKQAPTLPLDCPKCGHAMELLDKDNPFRNLTAVQLKEEAIGANEFTVWRCPECGETSSIKHEGRLARDFFTCPDCKARAMTVTKREVVKRANFFQDGLQQNTLVCQCCGYTKVDNIRLDKDNTFTRRLLTSAGSGGGGRASGSWGGGYSSGGGAGRRF